MNRNPLRLSILVVCLVWAMMSTAAAKDKVIIFHAGSLSVPFAKIEKMFRANFRDFVMKITSTEMWKTVCLKLISDHFESGNFVTWNG